MVLHVLSDQCKHNLGLFPRGGCRYRSADGCSSQNIQPQRATRRRARPAAPKKRAIYQTCSHSCRQALMLMQILSLKKLARISPGSRLTSSMCSISGNVFRVVKTHFFRCGRFLVNRLSNPKIPGAEHGNHTLWAYGIRTHHFILT